MSDARVQIDLRGVDRKISNQAFRRGRIAMASQMAADMNRFVPLKNSYLRKSGIPVADGSLIIWNSVYAHRQFTAPPGWHYTTPGTGPHWDQKAKQAYGKQWTETFARGAGLK